MNPGPKRSIPEIQQEYQNLCLKAGHLQYQVFTHERDIDMINNELRDLNLEVAAAKAEEAKEAASAPVLVADSVEDAKS